MLVRIKRGEVLPFNFGTDTNITLVHCLVVSDDAFNHVSASTVIVVPITATDASLPCRIRLEGADMGLNSPAFAACEQVRSVKRDRITGESVGMVSHDTVVEVERALMRMLGIKPTTRAKGWGR